MSTSANKWKKTNAYKPGIEWKNVPGYLKKDFVKCRREYWATGTASAKEDKRAELKIITDRIEDE
jgi:hypothetical protein